MLSSRSLIAQYVSCIVDGGMTADDVEVHSLPLYHCAQLDCFLGPDVYLGATSIILPGPDPDAAAAHDRGRAGHQAVRPPTVWISLLRSATFDRTDLSSLRKGYYGASPMPVEVLREMQRAAARTSGSGTSTARPRWRRSRRSCSPHDQLSHAGSAGRPALNVETRLVDDDGEEVGPGEIGEIVHRSPHATLGYWNDEAKTAEPSAAAGSTPAIWGVLDADGYLSVVDRKKDMIKTGGENVASREVEETIYLLSEVSEVAVFGIADPRWIEAVVAVVVPKPAASLTPEAVIAHCRSRLAGFKRPKYVVVLDSLPKNPSGKILKRDLRERYADLAQTPDPAPRG